SADLALMRLMDEAAVSYQAVLTKADKIKPPRLEEVVAHVAGDLATHPAAFARVLATSAQSGLGLAELRAELAALLAAHGVSSRRS
ncbi:MAG TPA: YihA family ribosome biogenesis GTP-binding protein, partial [Hyphomicrobiaceae bacterium]|nr:YihA family ribosome biogenesis GTP-binding protein [Hyphomicrobiaceae bacterium]